MLLASLVKGVAADADSVLHRQSAPLTADSIHAIVVDAETGMRISNASIRLDNGDVTKSRWDGSVTIGNNFTMATVSCIGYMGRKMNREEVGDTITLVSTNVHLNEVVVYGMGQKLPQMHFKPIDHTTAELMRASGGGFNILGLVYSLIKKKKSAKKAKFRRKLENY